ARGGRDRVRGTGARSGQDRPPPAINPAEVGLAVARGAAHAARASRGRGGHRQEGAGAQALGRDRAQPPRAARRARLSVRAAEPGRADRRADPQRVGCVRRHDLGPALPPRALGRVGAARAGPGGRHAVRRRRGRLPAAPERPGRLPAGPEPEQRGAAAAAGAAAAGAGVMRYRDAGVDVARAEALKPAIGAAIRSTLRPGERALAGGFAGAAAWPGGAGTLLAATMDGVGTKLHLALAAGRVADAAADLVFHCADDLLVHGARPLAFLDYVAQGRLDAGVV